MRIGKNLHIENRKKTYRKPVLEEVELDRMVVMVGESGMVDGPPGPVQGFTSQEESKPIYDETQQYPKDNPFGGGTPTYER